MKRLILIFVASVLTAAAAYAQKDTLRVLAIGNSFSQDAVEQNLFNIADECGYVFIIGNLYIGGCPLDKHYANSAADAPAYSYRKISADGVLKKTADYRISTALQEEDWDVITVQQSSPKSGFMDTYEPYLTDLLKYVRSFNSTARIYFHQTWAYALDSSHKHFPDYDCDQQKMYDMIMKSSHRASVIHGLGLIPCGSTIQNLRALGEEKNLTRDGYHLSHTVGRYAAALTWFRKLTGKNIKGVKYRPEGVGESQAAMAQIAATSAVSHPYKVSVRLVNGK